VWDDRDPLLEVLAETLRPGAGVVPDQPSDEEVAAVRAAVDRQFSETKAGRRLIGRRRPLPVVVGTAAAAALLSTVGVAAAATSVVEPLRLAQTVAHEIGLPVDDPNLSDAHSTLHDLTTAYQRRDAGSVARQLGKLRAEMGRLDFNDRNALLRQITVTTPGIASQLSIGPAAASNPGTASAPTGTTVATDSQTNATIVTTPPDTSTTPPPDTVPPDTAPSTTIPPDTEPSATIPPDTTPSTTLPPGTVPPVTTPPTTIPADTTFSTTIPRDSTSPTDPPTTAPQDTEAPDTNKQR
jgi:hypothetical protein